MPNYIIPEIDSIGTDDFVKSLMNEHLIELQTHMANLYHKKAEIATRIMAGRIISIDGIKMRLVEITSDDTPENPTYRFNIIADTLPSNMDYSGQTIWTINEYADMLNMKNPVLLCDDPEFKDVQTKINKIHTQHQWIIYSLYETIDDTTTA